ncbi:serine/threonine protein kinase [Ktedonobacter robiniae]|uniref:Protein kinase domain-containing protein n=1 Tax=Ktedonobacter robiniae TaxID=2778365 RepID=A0ABQ3UNV6_9CHLR|nr:serine/threonine-protein kinase [Ktedonobacter robiniae]GHO54383.1 hypothetical protein KSB_28580 [Ktedonobacter robiniae]
MTERVGQILGNYKLIRLLGQGGFADVYLGEHIHLKSLAAIKVLYTRLTDELKESFLNEARILAHLTHPHIIHILDFGLEANGTPFLVMEYAPHGTVRRRYPSSTKLPLATVVAYIKQIADGLQYAHDQKLIHRDLKPDNLLIGQKEELLLSDFGVAIISQTTTHSRTTEKGIAGTITYMAPEQLQGKPQFASDQYGLGIIAYEWLCGTRPFQGTVVEVFNQHLAVPPAPLHQYVPALSPDVEQVVLTALAKEPDKRFANVKAFALALEQASQHDVRTYISKRSAASLAPAKSAIPHDSMGAYEPGEPPLPGIGQMTPIASPNTDKPLSSTIEPHPPLVTPVPGALQSEPSDPSKSVAHHTATSAPALVVALSSSTPTGPASGATPVSQPGPISGDAPYFPINTTDIASRRRASVFNRKELLLVALILLALLGLSTAGIFSLRNIGDSANSLGARNFGTSGSTSSLTALAGNPSPNGGSTSTPRPGVTSTVPPTSVPGVLPPTSVPGVSSTVPPTLKSTPTPKPTPTPPGCTLYTHWSLHPLGGTTGSDVFTVTPYCGGKVYVTPYSAPPYATQMRAFTTGGYYGPWVSFTTGSWSTLLTGLSTGTQFKLQARNVNSGDPYYTIYGNVKY